MKIFCQECGNPLKSEDVVCKDCGTRIIQPQKVSKNPMTKKQKTYFSIIGAIIVILIGFSVWSNSYYSKESTSKRFTEAIGQKDAKSLANLIVHEDGSKIIPIEAEALAKLVEREGKRSIEDYFSIQPHGKFLGVFQKHKVEMINQYAYFEGPLKPLTFQFNKKVVKEEDRGDDFVLFGPLSPGIYDVETKFENEFGKGLTTSEIYMWNSEGDQTWIPVELPIVEVMFEVENYSNSVMKNVSVIVNEVEIPVDVEGVTEFIGPILLDGTQKAKIVVEYPWGEVASENMMIDSEHQYLSATIFTKEQETEIANLFLQFGEELAKAKATNSIDVFTTITDDNKEIIQDQMLNYYINNDVYYSGQIEQMNMDANLVELLEDRPALYVNAELEYKEANYSITETPEFESQLYPFVFEITYDEQQKKWLIQSEYERGYVDNPTHVLKGSGTVHEPNGEKITTAKVEHVKNELDVFMESYVYASVDAINYHSIAYVENLMTKDGPAVKESEDYISYLEEKDISEEVLSISVEKVEEKDIDLWEVTYIAEYRIFYPDKELVKKFNTVTTVKKVDGQWLAHELISTEEL